MSHNVYYDINNNIMITSICEEYRDALIREMRWQCAYRDNQTTNWSRELVVDRGSTIVYCQNPGETINEPCTIDISLGISGLTPVLMDGGGSARTRSEYVASSLKNKND